MMPPTSSLPIEPEPGSLPDGARRATVPSAGTMSSRAGQTRRSGHEIVREPRPAGLVAAVRRRWRFVAATLMAALALGSAAAFLPTPTFQANAQLFIATDNMVASMAAQQAYQGGLLAEQRAQSYAGIIDIPLVIDPVIRQLGLLTTTRELQSRIEATAVPGTVLVNIAVQDSSASRAARIANAVATEFTQLADQIETRNGKEPALVYVMTIRPAETPLTPVSPSRTQSLVLALIAGIALGLLAAVGREATDTKVRTAEDVSDVTSVPVVAAVPDNKAADVNPIDWPSVWSTARVDAFRRLRINLSYLTSGESSRAVVVTSPETGDGKTSTAVNLAVTLAVDGSDVVLVDADLRGGLCASMLGLPQGTFGLSEVLRGTSSLADTLTSAGKGLSLTVLGRGSVVPDPGPLLAARLSAVLDELLDAHDFVVLDAPPVLPVADPLGLSYLGVPYLVVVRAGRTRKHDLARTLSELQTAGATLIGVVMNRAKGPSEQTWASPRIVRHRHEGR